MRKDLIFRYLENSSRDIELANRHLLGDIQSSRPTSEIKIVLNNDTLSDADLLIVNIHLEDLKNKLETLEKIVKELEE